MEKVWCSLSADASIAGDKGLQTRREEKAGRVIIAKLPLEIKTKVQKVAIHGRWAIMRLKFLFSSLRMLPTAGLRVARAAHEPC